MSRMRFRMVTVDRHVDQAELAVAAYRRVTAKRLKLRALNVAMKALGRASGDLHQSGIAQGERFP
jgi:hypothetical protein